MVPEAQAHMIDRHSNSCPQYCFSKLLIESFQQVLTPLKFPQSPNMSFMNEKVDKMQHFVGCTITFAEAFQLLYRQHLFQMWPQQRLY